MLCAWQVEAYDTNADPLADTTLLSTGTAVAQLTDQQFEELRGAAGVINAFASGVLTANKLQPDGTWKPLDAQIELVDKTVVATIASFSTYAVLYSGTTRVATPPPTATATADPPTATATSSRRKPGMCR